MIARSLGGDGLFCQLLAVGYGVRARRDGGEGEQDGAGKTNFPICARDHQLSSAG